MPMPIQMEVRSFKVRNVSIDENFRVSFDQQACMPVFQVHLGNQLELSIVLRINLVQKQHKFKAEEFFRTVFQFRF